MKNLDGWMSEKSDKSIVNLKLPKYGSSHLNYSNTGENIDKIDLLTEQTEQKQNNGEIQENKFMLAKATCEEGKFKLELDKNNNQIVTIDINDIGKSKLTKDDFLLPMRGNEKDSTKEPVELPKKTELDLFKNDQSLKFDGLKDYLKIPHNKKFNFNNQDDFTIEVWLKIDREQLDKEFGDNSIIEKWSSDEKAGYPFAIRYEQETGRIWAQQYYVIDQNRGKIESVNSIKENETTGEPKILRIDDGLFHHIAFVKSNDELSLYIDGIPVDKSVNKLHDVNPTNIIKNQYPSTANKSALYIACRGRSNDLKTGKKTGNHFRGQIDEIRIWKVALSEDQIQAKSSDLEFDSLKPEDKENLVGFWDFTNKNINNKINNNDYSEVHGDPQWSTQTRRNYFSAVDHQEKDFCTAYTIASAFEYSIRRATGDDIRISRSFIHQNAKFLSSIDNSSEDDSSGVSIKAVLKGMQIFGVLDEKYWQPNDHKLDDNAKTIAYALAQKDPLKQYLNLYRSGMEKINLLDQIKLFICAEFPIIFGLPLSETVVSLSEYNQGQIPFQFFCKKTGHTLLAVGYDDDKVITGYQEVFCDGDGINPKLTSKLNHYPNDIESKTNSLLNKFLSCQCKEGKIVSVELKPEKNDVLKDYLTGPLYDKNDQILRFSTKGAFKVRNSWGSAWGEQGYGWLPYAYLLTGLATDWYCIFDPEWNEMGGWGINNNADCPMCKNTPGRCAVHN
jgi:C1A family cysteine protease